MSAEAVAGRAVSDPGGIIGTVPPPTGPLVGRTDELGRLVAALADPATTGVVVAGDAGVGKTRLVAEAVAGLVAGGTTVVTGHCVLVGGETLPYLPVVEVLGRLQRSDPERVATLVAAHPPLAGLLPGGAAGGQLAAGELFEAVLGGLVDLGAETPLVLVVEDVHWADASTRDLLAFLLTRLADARCCLLVTVRSDDLHRRHPLRPMLAEWARLPGVTRVAVSPLAPPEMRELVTNHHHGWLDSEALERIVEKSGGNPFFAEQLVVETDHGETVPADLADLLLVHVERLPPSARQVVHVAAVAGRRIAHPMLRAVAEVDDLDGALREAVDAYVLVAAGSDDYEFRHALLAEAVYDDLLPGERVRLHAAFARALAESGDPTADADLARHARAAHDLPTAYAAGVRAGEAALRLAAPAEALVLFESSLGMASQVPGSDPPGLTLRTAEAASLAGHPFRAVGLIEDALRGDLASDALRAELLVAAARYQIALDEPRDPTLHTAAALELIVPDPPTPPLARALMVHAHGHASQGRPRDAVRWATEALTVGRALRLDAVIVDAQTTLARASARLGEPDVGLQLLEESLADARARDDVAAEIRGWHGIGGIRFDLGDLQGSMDAYDAGRRRAVEAGRRWAAYALDCHLFEVVSLVQLGRFDAALDLTNVEGETPPPYVLAGVRAVSLGVHVARGTDHARPLLAALLPWTDRDGFYGYSAASAAIELAADATEAEAAYEEWTGRLSRQWHAWFAGRTRLAGLVLGRLDGTPDDVAVAERLVADARRAAAESARRQPYVGPEGLAWAQRVEAESARIRWRSGVDAPTAADLVDAWRATVEAFGYGATYEQTRSRARLVEALTAAGDPGAAAEADRLRADAEVMGIRVAGTARPAPTPAAPTGNPLTPREAQVLALLAEGRTNRQIGARLFITDKTVSVHVSNILAKLGAAGRTEAAAIAHRDGLL